MFYGERQFKICVVTVQSDEEPGISNLVQNWAEGNSIKFKQTAVYIKEQNSRVEYTKDILIILA